MAVLYPKGIIVVPKYIREILGWHEGVSINFQVENKKLVVEPEDRWEKEFEDIRKTMKKMSSKEISEVITELEKKRIRKWSDVH